MQVFSARLRSWIAARTASVSLVEGLDRVLVEAAMDCLRYQLIVGPRPSAYRSRALAPQGSSFGSIHSGGSGLQVVAWNEHEA